MRKGYTYVHVNNIIYNEGFFEPLTKEDFERLKDSIRNNGILVPLTVMEDKNNKGKYILLDGRNRYRAACELGFEKVPVEIIEVPEQVSVILHYDFELCRRHLDRETLMRKWLEERNYYMESVKKSLRSKIFQILKIEESEVIREKIDSMPLIELAILHDTLKSAFDISQKFTNSIAKQIAYKIYTATKDAADKTPEDVEKAIKQFYEKQLEELKVELQKKEEELFLLEEKINKLQKEKKELQEQYELVRKAKMEELENYIKEKTREYEEKIQELTEQLYIEKAKKHSPEEIEKLVNDLKKEFEKELREKEEEFRKEEAEWRKRIEDLQKQIIDLKKEFDKVKEEKRKLEEDLKAERAEKQRTKARFDDLLRAYQETTSEKALLNQIKVLREQLQLVLQIAYNLTSFDPHYISQIKAVWEDVEGIYDALKKYMEETILPSGNIQNNQMVA